ncbi:hypothetical protein [Sulfurimonas sp.]|uniref:hypothetical protein n=1 Tax=Sulfurimonas sp. TaxID=2022749 RepID=UPI0035657531
MGSSFVDIEDINIDNNTKNALEKTLNNIGDDWIVSRIIGLSKSYSSKLITFQDILDGIDDILYGEHGGEATLAMLQSAEDFKKEFSNAYQNVSCDIAS